MDNLLPGFQHYKNKIPEFIIKLYHILESPDYQDYLTWNNSSEILIKQPKKMEEKVLPHFFRHKHLTSFIRQLNMYKFSKVPKLTKERNYMYFKNQNFQRGQIKELTKITRNAKKSKKSNLQVEEQVSSPEKEDNLSIDLQLQQNQQLSGLEHYKKQVKQTIQELMISLRRLEGSHPDLKEELTASMAKCSQLLEVQHQNQNRSLINLSESDLNARLNGSEKFIHGLDPVLFPSQCNF